MREDIVVISDEYFAILDKENSENINGYELDNTTHNHIGELADYLYGFQVYNAWITPYTNISEMFTYNFIHNNESKYKIKAEIYNVNLDEIDIATYDMDSVYAKYIKIYREGMKDITFTIPENNDYLWKFDQYEDVTFFDLITMLQELKEKLPVSLINSPTYLGTKLLSYFNKNTHKEWIRTIEKPLDISIPLASSVVWKSDTIDYSKLYLHAYDKNSAFLSSYQSCLLGSGEYTEYTTIPFDEKKVGVWQVHITGNSNWDGNTLPLPYNKYTIDNWLWTPEIAIAQKLGYQIEMIQAKIWGEVHYIGREYAKFLFDTKEVIKQKYDETHNFGVKMAYDTIKKIYTETNGRLATPNKYSTPDKYSRVDWYSMIVADTRFKVLWQVKKFAEQGHIPIMIVTDCLYYLSNEKNPYLAIPGMLDNENRLGGYKLKYSVEFNRVSDMFIENRSVNDIAAKLNQLERQGEIW